MADCAARSWKKRRSARSAVIITAMTMRMTTSTIMNIITMIMRIIMRMNAAVRTTIIMLMKCSPAGARKLRRSTPEMSC